MTALISVNCNMVRRCPTWRGVSCTIKTRVWRSFKVTAAARVSRVEVMPLAISEMVRTERGNDHAQGQQRAQSDSGADVLRPIHNARLGGGSIAMSSIPELGVPRRTMLLVCGPVRTC